MSDAGKPDSAPALEELLKKYEASVLETQKLQASLIQSEKMSALGQLTAGVAHEINNPLGVILGYAEMLTQEATKDNKRWGVPAQSIRQEALRCKELVQNLLAFSRCSEGAFHEAVDVEEALEPALALVRVRAKTCRVTVITEIASGLPQIQVNRTQFHQVLINLANNAIDAMLPKGGRLTVSAQRSAREPGQLAIRIQDTGIGIPPEIRSKIFEPFFTTKEAGKGTGLGLALVCDIVKKHQGRIDMESDVGKGAAFTVYWPIEKMD